MAAVFRQLADPPHQGHLPTIAGRCTPPGIRGGRDTFPAPNASSRAICQRETLRPIRLRKVATNAFLTGSTCTSRGTGPPDERVRDRCAPLGWAGACPAADVGRSILLVRRVRMLRRRVRQVDRSGDHARPADRRRRVCRDPVGVLRRLDPEPAVGHKRRDVGRSDHDHRRTIDRCGRAWYPRHGSAETCADESR